MPNVEKICPIMTRPDYRSKCVEEECAWYMSFSGTEEPCGVCSVAFGMLCQRGIAGDIDFFPERKQSDE